MNNMQEGFMPLVFWPGCDCHVSCDFEFSPGCSMESQCQGSETLNLPVSSSLIACKMMSITKFRPHLNFFSLTHKLDVRSLSCSVEVGECWWVKKVNCRQVSTKWAPFVYQHYKAPPTPPPHRQLPNSSPQPSLWAEIHNVDISG